MDLEPFSRINPCGYEGLAVTSVRRLLGDDCPGMDTVADCLITEVSRRLD